MDWNAYIHYFRVGLVARLTVLPAFHFILTVHS